MDATDWTSPQGHDGCGDWLPGAFRSLTQRAATWSGTRLRPGTSGRDSASAEIYRRLLSGDSAGAEALCRELAEDSRDTMALDAILQAIDRSERDWRAGRLGYGALTFLFWNIQRLIECLHQSVAGTAPRLHVGRALVALSEGEQHSLGAQIVADELRHSGWDVALDLSGSSQAILDTAGACPFDLVALSVGHDGAMSGLADFIELLRRSSRAPRTRIVLGGAALDNARESYSFLGADLVARTATEAVERLGLAFTGARAAERN